MKIYELCPVNGRKSFYGKALVKETGKETILQSYQTEVCKIDENGHFVKLWNGYSNTTMNHINAFLSLFGIPSMKKKEWEALETEKKKPCSSNMTWQESLQAMYARRKGA